MNAIINNLYFKLFANNINFSTFEEIFIRVKIKNNIKKLQLFAIFNKRGS